MVDIVITAADVISAGATPISGIAGEAIIQGQTIFLNSADNKFWLADNNDTEPKAAVRGIATNAALTGQPIAAVSAGNLTLSSVLTAGMTYVLSSTPGGIAPVADLLSNDFTTLLGVATSPTNLKLSINVSGAQTP